ncbi:MAG: hypothetical protein ABIL46_09105 [candidate division WOR-3 bacterium]
MKSTLHHSIIEKNVAVRFIAQYFGSFFIMSDKSDRYKLEKTYQLLFWNCGTISRVGYRPLTTSANPQVDNDCLFHQKFVK